VILIPKGSTASIVSYLDKKNYDMNYIDKFMIDRFGYPQSGWIDLKATKMSKFDFLYKLTRSKAALKKVTLIPGETYYFFLQEVAKKLNISTIKLFELYAQKAYMKDGNILADTYHIPYGMNETQLINYLLNDTKKRYKNFSKRIFGLYNKKNWYKYIIIASIIQKEAASKEEMPLVSSVIYNRLQKNMKLQMDGTLNYANFSHTKVTPKMIEEDTTSYNTYKNNGLPDDPICAVELDAIKAAIFPAKTDYLYFMKSANGKGHIFTNSYKKHLKVIKKVKKIKRKQKKKINKAKTVTKKKKTPKTPKKIKQTKPKTIDNSEKLKKLWN
jgi:UPF0755 protein